MKRELKNYFTYNNDLEAERSELIIKLYRYDHREIDMARSEYEKMWDRILELDDLLEKGENR